MLRADILAPERTRLNHRHIKKRAQATTRRERGKGGRILHARKGGKALLQQKLERKHIDVQRTNRVEAHAVRRFEKRENDMLRQELAQARIAPFRLGRFRQKSLCFRRKTFHACTPLVQLNFLKRFLQNECAEIVCFERFVFGDVCWEIETAVF